MSALRSMRRLVGVSTRIVPASVHYIRRERGRCLTRGRRFRAGVNKLGKTEPETGRRGAEVAWNPVGLGGPTAAGSNGETNGDAKFFERLRRRAGRCRQPTGTQISGGGRFGSSGRIRTYNPSVNSRILFLLPQFALVCCLLLI